MRDAPLFLTVCVILGGVAVLLTSAPTPTVCPQVTTVVEYLPLVEPAPMRPSTALPSFDSQPIEIAEARAAPEPKAEEKTDEPVAEARDEPSPRHHRRRHYWRRWRR